MSELNELSCVVYVDTDLSLDKLATTLSSALSASASGPLFAPTIRIGEGEVEVRGNSDSDPGRATQFPDGFLFFRYRVELCVPAKAATEEQIAAVSVMLNALWSQGIVAIAVCDYEDDLPQKGGYKDRSLPWPGGHHLGAHDEGMDSVPQPGSVQP
jgi:hypothetical protein